MPSPTWRLRHHLLLLLRGPAAGTREGPALLLRWHGSERPLCEARTALLLLRWEAGALRLLRREAGLVRRRSEARVEARLLLLRWEAGLLLLRWEDRLREGVGAEPAVGLRRHGTPGRWEAGEALRWEARLLLLRRGHLWGEARLLLWRWLLGVALRPGREAAPSACHKVQRGSPRDIPLSSVAAQPRVSAHLHTIPPIDTPTPRPTPHTVGTTMAFSARTWRGGERVGIAKGRLGRRGLWLRRGLRRSGGEDEVEQVDTRRLLRLLPLHLHLLHVRQHRRDGLALRAHKQSSRAGHSR